MNAAGDTGSATIQTFTGRYVQPLAMSVDDVDIRDIAHALSNVCRFQGHVREFYSVAQHSVLCSRLVPAGFALAALLHDSPEAYICDFSGPLKRDTELGRLYKEMELAVAAVIEDAAGLEHGAFDDPDVKRADWAILQVEGRDLMPQNDWARDDILAGMVIDPWSPRRSRHEFMERYEELA